MADFSDTDESKVEEILSKATDYVVHKQIASLNLSDSILPDHLDARFRHLKTCPSSKPSHIESDIKPDVNSGDPDPLDLDYSKSNPGHSPSSSSQISPISDFGSGRSVSPPMSGCLCCSPRKVSKKKSSFRGGDGGRRLNDDVLAEMGVGSLSRRKQDKIMKMAVEEEKKLARESQKLAKWALHASARMEARGLHLDDDVVSHN